MRAKEFIKEAAPANDDPLHRAILAAAQTIIRDCSYYLKLIKFAQKKAKPDMFFRGMKAAVILIDQPLENYRYEVRSDRRPLDTSREVHDYCDNWLLDHVGWRPRSTGLFVTGHPGRIADFGTPCAIFPIGQFGYLWAPPVGDFTYYTNNVGAPEDLDRIMTTARWQSNNGLAKYMSSYSDNEMVLNVREYYAIPLASTTHYDGTSSLSYTTLLSGLRELL